jgi:hypothetical protein
MRDLTKEENEMAVKLFAPTNRPPPHKGEGETHLTVRFDPDKPGAIFYGPHARQRKIRMKGATVLSYKFDPSARTPTGGKWIKQSLLVRTEDGRRWTGTVKTGTDVVILRRVKAKEKEC